ncbi:MAG: hypothetical protein LCH39_04625, partial [Proteobacteria bacterium]|nr:hypothetical protein [Pseudomonadota bacterium]
PRDPTPISRRVGAPREKTCSSFCLSWLHPIWKLEPPTIPGRFNAYAVHVYPWHDNPGQASGEIGRRNRLARFVLARCGIEGRKPCWVTEWGFRDKQESCPPQETNRLTLTQEMRRTFAQYAQSGRLKGLLVYAWNDPLQAFATYRCGKLTESGRAAIRP